MGRTAGVPGCDRAALTRTRPLTGLPNRPHFLARLEEACRENHDRPDGFAVLFLDLDDFKTVDDLHGHATGDAVLSATADALTSCLREADLVARMGGDEFVVLLTRLRHGGHDALGEEADRSRPRLSPGTRTRSPLQWLADD